MKFLYSRVFVALTLVWGAVAAGAEEAEAGKALLLEASSWAAGLESLTGNAQIKLNMDMGGKSREIELSTELALAGNDKLYMKLEDGVSAAEVYADEKQYTVYFAQEKEYMEAEAKPRAELLGMMGHGPMREGALLLADLLHNQTGWLEEAKAIRFLGEAPLPGGETQARHFEVETEDFTISLWLGPKSAPLPSLIEMDLSEMMKGIMPQAGEDLSVQLALHCRDWRPNADIPAERFTFTPPEGAKKATAPAPEGSDDPLLGKAAPDLTLDLLSGGEMTLSSHKGKAVVMLDFWATWCGPCRTALPIVAKVAEAYKDKGVIFYAVNQAEEPDAIKAFLKKADLDIPVALDKEQKAAELFGVRGIPRMVIIDKEGLVQRVHVGASPNLEEELTADLDALLSGKAKEE